MTARCCAGIRTLLKGLEEDGPETEEEIMARSDTESAHGLRAGRSGWRREIQGHGGPHSFSLAVF